LKLFRFILKIYKKGNDPVCFRQLKNDPEGQSNFDPPAPDKHPGANEPNTPNPEGSDSEREDGHDRGHDKNRPHWQAEQRRSTYYAEYYPKEPNPGSYQPPFTRYGDLQTGQIVALFEDISINPHISRRIFKLTILCRGKPACLELFGWTNP
jgi:hypothetical protein